ncbi:MAG: molybdopterin-dependent oxidoreductase [Firmicutes bacterium]|nr:molybdopterin-dependent oxidoreductase [Bacillota bacterium]
MEDLNRREFLKAAFATGGLGLAGLAGCGVREDPLAYFRKPEDFMPEKPPVPGEKKWFFGETLTLASSCYQCSVGCGIKVKVEEGRAVKIEGGDSPVNLGGIGPKGQSGLQVLYDPDRIQNPRSSLRKRGSGRWKEISWNEAISELAEKLTKIRKVNPQGLALLCGRPRGMMVELWQRFCQVFGTPNFFDPFSTSDGGMKTAANFMMGTQDLPGTNWSETLFVLSFGAALFETTCQGIYFTSRFSSNQEKNPVKRGRLVQVEPVCSLTAEHADEWIPILPGAYDALALGISHVLVKENLYDRKFVETQTYGFENWKDSEGKTHKGFKELLGNYSPEVVAKMTGVPSSVIVKLARDLRQYRPSVVFADGRSTSTSNGFEIARSVLALNALLGSINSPGGLLTQIPPPLSRWAAVKLDETAEKGLKFPRLDRGNKNDFPLCEGGAVEVLPDKILKQEPYSLKALFLYYVNPLFTRINPDRWEKALSTIPFIVSFSPFMDESAWFSDLILPDCTYLERWEDACIAPTTGYPIFGARQPVVEPLYNTKNTGDVVIELAKKMGHPFDLNFPWGDFKEVFEKRAEGIHKIRKGSITSHSRKKFYENFYEKGYWENPPYPFNIDLFKTPSKKFEFCSQTIKSMMKKEFSNFEQICFPHAELPHWEGNKSDFPFYFLPYKPITYAEGSGANIPRMWEIHKLQCGVPWNWESWIEISPEDAALMKLSEKDRVKVSSPVGSFGTHLKISSKIQRGMIWMALGTGHTQYGRFAKNKGVNPKEILFPYLDPLTGLPGNWGTRVKVEKQ